MEKYLDETGVAELSKKIKTELDKKLDKTATANFPKIEYGANAPETLEEGTVFFVYM